MQTDYRWDEAFKIIILYIERFAYRPIGKTLRKKCGQILNEEKKRAKRRSLDSLLVDTKDRKGSVITRASEV